jgi:hypothetical protein
VQVAEKVIELACSLMEEGTADPVLARAGAELLAAGCCIGSEALAQRQARALCGQLASSLAEGGSPEVR